MGSAAKSSPGSPPLGVVEGGKKLQQNLYHSDSYVLSAVFEQPVSETINPIAEVNLLQYGDGNYQQFKSTGPFQFDGILSFQSGYAQIGAYKSAVHGYTTCTTAAISGLKIFNVVTVDSAVAQILVEFQPGDRVPTVSFMGTRFENLCICGKNIDVALNLNVLGPKPAGDQPYMADSPDWTSNNEVKTTLVQSVTGISAAGPVIDLPGFGQIKLAELILKRTPDPNAPNEFIYSFTVEMMRIELTRHAKGRVIVLKADPNGGTQGGG
jgi:hypothetical protein